MIALAWIKDTLTGLDVTQRKLSPAAMVTLARALPPSLKSLTLRRCDIAADGNDMKGVEQLCLTLLNLSCGLEELECVLAAHPAFVLRLT